MATLVKRGSRFQAVIRIAGRPSESRTFESRVEARQWAQEREDEIRKGSVAVPSRDSFAKALARYARDVSPTKKGKRWEVLRLNALQKMKIATLSIGLINASDIAEWRDNRLRTVSAATVAREMNLLRSVFEMARKEWRLIRANPMTDVGRPKSPPPRRRRVSDDEIKQMRLALGYRSGAPENQSQRVALAFLFAIETAMRAGEIVNLTWQDVYADYVVLPETKNGDRREVALSKKARDIIKLFPKNTSTVFGIEPSLRDALFRKARANAAIRDLHFHDSRAEAIWRLSKKLDVLQLARMIGHRDPKSLMFYYNESASEIAKRLG